jgi:hypothetical protein
MYFFIQINLSTYSFLVDEKHEENKEKDEEIEENKEKNVFLIIHSAIVNKLTKLD